MKNKKIACLFPVILAACVLLTGCAQIRDKFVRKPKEEDTLMRYTAVRSYDVKPSLDLYTTRYIYWKNWHRELLDVLTDANKKKAKTAVEQDISSLMDMKRMLVTEKADELQVAIDDMSAVEKDIKEENVTAGNEVRIRKKLETLGRQIKRDFSYTKMGEFISNEFGER